MLCNQFKTLAKSSFALINQILKHIKLYCLTKVYIRCSIDVDGLKHILLHHGDKRSGVYRRLFQELWYGNSVGKVNSSSTAIPTYVFPIEIRTVI